MVYCNFDFVVVSVVLFGLPEIGQDCDMFHLVPAIHHGFTYKLFHKSHNLWDRCMES